MREKTTVWLCIASFLVGAGLVVFAVVMTLNHWDFKKLDTSDFVTETVKPVGSFKNIKISADSADVRLLPTESDTCSVVFYVPDKWDFSATVEGDTLMIRSKDDRAWTDRIGIQLKSPEITVYLPDNRYEYLTATSDSGDFDLPQDFTFVGIEIETESGDVLCSSSSDSYAKFVTDSGHISLCDMTASNINVDTESGDVDLKRCIASLSVDITTQSGDVSGHFLHDVACSANTKSGSVKVPGDTAGVPCKITTKSGDVKISADAGLVPTPTEAVTTPEPTPTPPESIETPTPTPTEPTEAPTPITYPSLIVKHLVTEPQENPAKVVMNTTVLYPGSATFRVIVRYSEESVVSHTTVGFLYFEDCPKSEKYRLERPDNVVFGEDVYFEFTMDEIRSDAQQLGAKKLLIDIDSATGFTLVGVDVEWEE